MTLIGNAQNVSDLRVGVGSISSTQGVIDLDSRIYFSIPTVHFPHPNTSAFDCQNW